MSTSGVTDVMVFESFPFVEAKGVQNEEPARLAESPDHVESLVVREE